MKVCELCGEEIFTKDGENRCGPCDGLLGPAEPTETKKLTTRRLRAENRKAREDALRSVGLVKVRGAMGGTYWE